jgi:hypothetical protein
MDIKPPQKHHDSEPHEHSDHSEHMHDPVPTPIHEPAPMPQYSDESPEMGHTVVPIATPQADTEPNPVVSPVVAAEASHMDMDADPSTVNRVHTAPRRGVGVWLMLLVAIIAAGLAGGGVWYYMNQKSQANSTDLSSQLTNAQAQTRDLQNQITDLQSQLDRAKKPATTTTAPSDGDMQVLVAKTYANGAGGAAAADPTVKLDKAEGAFSLYMVTYGGKTYQAILKKDGTSYKVAYWGVNKPSKAVGQQLGLPAGWADTK